MIRQKPTKTITGACTTTDSDNGYRIICNSSSDFVITLHTATGRYNFELEVDNIGSGEVTINGQVLKQYTHAHVGNNSGSGWSVVVGGGSMSKEEIETVLIGEISSHTHADNVLSGSSVPTASTTGTLGQFYLETTTPKLYQCTAVGATYTWTEVGTGSGGGGSYTLPQATGTTLGGIIAAEKTTESAEVKIDTATGKLYAPAAGEAANGIPAGGTAGQTLSKIDGTDYNAEWIDAPSGGSSYIKYDPDEPPASPHANDDEFNDASINVKWSWANQGTATAEEGGITGKISITSAGDSRLRCLTQAVPFGSWEMTAKVQFGGDFISDSYAGIVIMPATDGIIEALVIGKDGGGETKFRAEKWSSWTSWSTERKGVTYGGTVAYLKIAWDGTNLTYYVSQDGAAYPKLFAAFAPDFTIGRFGIAARGNALPNYFDWFRVKSL